MRLARNVFLLCCFGIIALGAQENTTLRTASNDRLVYLSWLPQKELTTYKIYRSSSPISIATISNATRVGVTSPQASEFADIVPQPGVYYYAVLPQSAPLTAQNLTLTTTPVTVSEVSQETEGAVIVRNLESYITSSGILLSFTTEDPNRQFTLVRSEAAIQNIEDLTAATVVTPIKTMELQFIDQPPLGVPVYYSLHDSALFSQRLTPIIFHENTLVSPIVLTAVFADTTDETSLNIPVASFPTLFVARDDISPSSDPGSQDLQRILIDHFLKKDYATTISALQRLLAQLPGTAPTRLHYRTHLYMAQSYFAINRPEESLTAFIAAQDDLTLYPEIEKFIVAILTATPDLLPRRQ